MKSVNQLRDESVPGPLGQSSPEAIVASAQRYLASNLAMPIAARAIAQAIGVTVADLKTSFRFVLQQDLKIAILEMRLKALHALIEQAPERCLEDLAVEVGLLLDQEIQHRFHQQFWITPDKWHQMCRGRLQFRRAR